VCNVTSDKWDQIYFKLCSDHLSIEAIPKRRIKVNFAKIREHPPENYEIVMWTAHFVIVRSIEGQEITLRRDGRMLIRNVKSEASARQSAAEIMDLILEDF
jgi:hypothetical protein